MKFVKDGAASGIKTLLHWRWQLICLPAPLGRAARATGEARSDVKIKTPAGSFRSYSTSTQSTQEQEASEREALPRRGRIAFASDRDAL